MLNPNISIESFTDLLRERRGANGFCTNIGPAEAKEVRSALSSEYPEVRMTGTHRQQMPADLHFKSNCATGLA